MSPETSLPALIDKVERLSADLSDRFGGLTPGAPVEYVYGELGDSVGVGELDVVADVKIEAPTTTARPYVGPVIQVAKRAVKRATQWYVDPLAIQVSDFHHDLIAVLRRLTERMDRRDARVRRQLDAMRFELADLRARLAELEATPADADSGGVTP